MKKIMERRDKWLNIRLSEKEFETLKQLQSETTCKAFSEYARKIILGGPINVKYRNRSLDDFVADLVALKKQLHLMNGHFNEALIKLRTLREIPELQQWMFKNEQDKTDLMQLIQSIYHRMNEIYNLWLRG